MAHAAPAPGLDTRGLPPHFALFLLRHPEAARHIVQRRAAAGAPKSELPKIVSGTITTPSVDVMMAPAAPALEIKYSAPRGLAEVYFLFTAPAGSGVYEVASVISTPDDQSGTLTFQAAGQPIGLYAEPGNWTLNEAVLIDGGGNTRFYTETQLKALFPSLTFALTNTGTPDDTAPTFSTGKILTPTVHIDGKKPYFAAELGVADNLSGVNALGVVVQDPMGYDYEAFVAPSAPVLSGTLAAYLEFYNGNGYNTGTWTIVALELTDVAGNVLNDTSAADIKAVFGRKTFKVVD